MLTHLFSLAGIRVQAVEPITSAEAGPAEPRQGAHGQKGARQLA